MFYIINSTEILHSGYLLFFKVHVLSTSEEVMSSSLCGKQINILGDGNKDKIASTNEPFMTMNEHCYINQPSDEKVSLTNKNEKKSNLLS